MSRSPTYGRNRRASPPRLTGLLLALGLVTAACAGAGTPPSTTSPTSTGTVVVDAGAEPVGPVGTATIHEDGWTTPIKLGFNDEGWEDSPYLTRDGRSLIFFYHPWPNLATAGDELTELILADPEGAAAQGLDGALYVSDRPFSDKRLHPVSADGSPAFECCAAVDARGRLFYVSNRAAWEQGADVTPGIYLDGRLLDIEVEGQPDNPYWCELRDELWFDCPSDGDLCVMRRASAQGFAGPVEKAPYPVNAANREAVQDSQAFLTDDCDTLYLTSNRDDPDRLQIYRLYRLDEDGDEWSDPELFISAPTHVAELSMTADGTELAFAQVFWREDGTPGIDIYWARRR